jgi:two-component system, chemotaxis family, sensor histidine kinase and response regulator WspE
MTSHDVSQSSLLDLFRAEAEEQSQTLTAGLLALERDPTAADKLASCMRAAHSLKGAARIVGIPAGVSVAHTMESCFVAAQQGLLTLRQKDIDELLRAVDVLRHIAQTQESEPGQPDEPAGEVAACVAALNRLVESGDAHDEPGCPPAAIALGNEPSAILTPSAPPEEEENSAHERVLRVTADNLNRLLGLASECLVESRRLRPFAASLLRLKRQHYELSGTLQQLRESLSGEVLNEEAQAAFIAAERRALECRQFLSQRLAELEAFDRRVANVSHRMYEGTLACRMRPFADGTRLLPRMVRDLSRALGKEVRFEIFGAATQVDRDILAKLDAPIGHLLRNAVDHGIELPQERRAAGKLQEGVIRLEARHSAGRLLVVVADDGGGIDLRELRATVVARGLATADTVSRLSEAELLEFLLLPGFSLAKTVTDISGRGVGLDAVQDMLKRLRGTLRITSQQGKGTQFQLQLPLTLSVVRTLLIEVGGEPYAIPLASIIKTLKIPKLTAAMLEGRPHFELGGQRVGLVTAHQVLESASAGPAGEEWPVVVLGGADRAYGVVVDRLLDERELVVQPFDQRLGKLKDVAAGALMEDGSPVLIIDVEDVIRSIEKLVVGGALAGVAQGVAAGAQVTRKRVLVVDDSLTVRELERKLLANGGYEVEVAVDGMDGWNAVRSGQFDLMVTDIDMPRMDGLELVTLLRRDPRLKSLPVMIVSYKDRPEDRQRGLDAGADYYLAKSSFHDQTLLNAVAELIGAAAA